MRIGVKSMATAAEHIAQANHNQDVLDRMLVDPSPFWDWIAIVAFYKAVHSVEAVIFENEKPPHKHSASHKNRGALLKMKYPDMWRNYWPLLKASKVARYLEYEEKGITHGVVRFSDYMPGTVVVAYLLNHDFVQFEKAAAASLSDPSALKRFSMPANTKPGGPV